MGESTRITEAYINGKIDVNAYCEKMKDVYRTEQTRVDRACTSAPSCSPARKSASKK